MTEEDEEFSRIEREAAMKRRKYDDDDIQDYVRPWVGLTKSDIREIIVNLKRPEDLYKAIEQRLKEKNHG
jgi:hypothetical protein